MTSSPQPDRTPASELVRTEARALLELAMRLDGPMQCAFARATELVADAASRGKRVIVLGMGKSGLIARKIAATLCSTGTPAHFLHPAEARHGDLGMIAAGDLMIALSASGETEELLRILPAIARFQEAYQLDALPNNQQFQVLYNIAVMQIQSEKYDDALKTLADWFKVTGAQKSEAYALQANAYYRLDKYQESVDAMKKALSLTDKPNESYYQILMASYAQLEQYDEAAKVLEQQLAKNPGDVKLTTQLATVYVKGKQDQKAVDLLVAAKQKGLLTSESDYKLMGQLYDQLDKPKEGAAVLAEGFSKNIIKPSFEMYKLLGDSYALANDDAHAIEAYGKASALAKDGNVDYVRGSLLMNNDRMKEAVEALRQAIAKGSLKQPGEAQLILGDAENNVDNTPAAIAAWEKAKAYPSTRQMAEQRLKNHKGGKGPVVVKKGKTPG